MEVYLIRHGIAADPSLYPQDSDRPLTPEGEKKTKKVAQRLVSLDLQLETILTSPLLRAQQTAQILHKAGLSPRLEIFPPLAPDGDFKLWLNWLREQSYQAIALVGHQPDLADWAEMLIWGTSQGKLILKKAGIIGLSIPSQGDRSAASTLFLLTSPKWLI